MTVDAARRCLSDAFRAAGLDTPELDARLLASHVLGLDHGALVAAAGRKLDGPEVAALMALAERRLDREPAARILGRKEFWGLTLDISAATLVPRPETETVVETALAALDASGPRTRALRLADLGTGSGALLLALLSELPGAFGIGTDLDEAALVTARHNADRLGLSARVRFAASDFSAALVDGFDLVVSNPPYVATADIDTLAPEVRYDPRRALDGGCDGLDCYRAIIGDASRLLVPAGVLVLELGYDQAASVTAIAQAAGLAPRPARHDLSGVPRALAASVATLTP